MTSTRQQGNARENRCGKMLEALGYCVCYARGSRGRDIFAVHHDPSQSPRCIWVSVGGVNKRIVSEFRDLKSTPAPIDTVYLVALCRDKKWAFYSEDRVRHENIIEAIGHTKAVAA